ncbi:hypothetical protein H0B56_17170 [Haloechinothrix sp. YIM 98757]|uniref:Uncharacterized protein n=1 Tax=Haloechinothrix aidingensis TaxID=2752311 RepID=A0A838ADC0_9PSEU|nr:hypothetical protein [Haloechinothrix aidingensis]MBA0127284.1 hypothetical protein [Haloechinothrix aidingensis]
MTTDTTHAHTVFALGRGDQAELLGAFAGYLTPNDLVRLPIGRQVLASTTATDVRDHFARFALAWDVAGLDTFIRACADPHIPDAAPCHADQVADTRRRDVYAFDDGQWYHWSTAGHPQWHHLTLAANSTVIEHPVARSYGTDYVHTRSLDLPHLAAWIMGAATERLARSDVQLSARVHTEPTEDGTTIHLIVHNAHGGDLDWVSTELQSIARACNWTNPCDPGDRRFGWCAPCTDGPIATLPGEIVIVPADLPDE